VHRLHAKKLPLVVVTLRHRQAKRPTPAFRNTCSIVRKPHDLAETPVAELQ
jgi:hypothetical protein